MEIVYLREEITIQTSLWVFLPAFHLPAFRLPVVTWNIENCPQSSKQWVHSCQTPLTEVYLGVPRSRNLTLTPVTKKEIILKQNLDVSVPKYIGTISFVFHFLEQTQRPLWGAIVFGSCVDVISNTSNATLKVHGKSRIQPNSNFFSPKCFE